MGKKIYGKVIANKIIEQTTNTIKSIGESPKLGIVWVKMEDHDGSEIYVKHKLKKCRKAGIDVTLKEIDVGRLIVKSRLKDCILHAIDTFNNDDNCNAIIVQLPLPDDIPIEMIQEHINPDKDVDGFHPYNQGLLFGGHQNYVYHGAYPCTALAVYEILKSIDFEFEGKKAVVVGQGLIAGKPISQILMNHEMTVTMCHIKTSLKDFYESLESADLVVSAAGHPHLITKDHIKPGAVVIDVGINIIDGEEIVGDVAFDEVREVASWITPVPGGVGPVTVAMLIRNTLRLFCKQRQAYYQLEDIPC